MKNKPVIVFFLFLCVLLPAGLFAAEPNVVPTGDVGIRMLHIFIRADVNEVHFENIWAFERQRPNGPWKVSVDLPGGAAVSGFDEPGETELQAGGRTVGRKMDVDSLIDSVGFSFVLPNQDGVCRTQIAPGYPVNSMVVYVSGSAVKLAGNVLKLDEYRVSHSKFSGVYTAGNLEAGARVEINLSRLPSGDCRLLENICVVGLGLIVLIALLIVYWNQKAIKNKSVDNEACFK